MPQVYQRQLSKEGLQNLVDAKARRAGATLCSMLVLTSLAATRGTQGKLDMAIMSKEDLRKLFTLRQCSSDTHESFNCKRCPPKPKVPGPEEAEQQRLAEEAAQQAAAEAAAQAKGASGVCCAARAHPGSALSPPLTFHPPPPNHPSPPHSGAPPAADKPKKFCPPRVVVRPPSDDEADGQWPRRSVPSTPLLIHPPIPACLLYLPDLRVHRLTTPDIRLLCAVGVSDAPDPRPWLLQLGKPAEDDLASWGHHEGSADVPDPALQYAGADNRVSPTASRFILPTSHMCFTLPLSPGVPRVRVPDRGQGGGGHRPRHRPRPRRRPCGWRPRRTIRLLPPVCSAAAPWGAPPCTLCAGAHPAEGGAPTTRGRRKEGDPRESGSHAAGGPGAQGCAGAGAACSGDHGCG